MSSSSKNFFPTNKESLDQGLFQANLDLWHRFVPGLANQFRKFGGTSSQLLRNNEGDFNINHNGEMLLTMPSQKWAKKCAKDLRDGSNIFRVLNEPIGFPGIERDTIESMRQNANAKLTKPLEKFPTQSHSFHLVIFGSGLAEQIPLIAETTSCRNLIIVEPHVEFLYHSLYTFNWELVLKTFSQKNFKLTIIVENDPELVFIALADAVHTFAPHLTDGLTIYKSYEDDLVNHLAAETMRRSKDLVSSSGFFADECYMVNNAYRNLQHYRGYTYLKRDKVAPYPAFVVGSGPSLDLCYDSIRKHQDHAIVISCGTTIRLLLREGIKPDFHVELENTPEIASLCETVSKSYDLSSITLIASNTVNPGVSKYFGKTVYFFRNNLSSTPIFSLGEESSIRHPTPTVANLGLSFAQEFGCRDFYLFGIDLGAREIENHHAKGSAYESGEVLYEEKLNTPSRANFGGENILSMNVLLWSKDLLEDAVFMRRFGRRYYNCSDGVRITRIIPILSDTIKLNPHSGKLEYIEAAVSAFPNYNERLFKQAWGKTDLRSRISEMESRLLDELNAPHIRTFTELMADMSAIIVPRGERLEAENLFYRGSLFHTFSAMTYFANRVMSAEDLAKITDIGKQAIGAQICEIARQVTELCDRLEDTKT